MFDVSLPTGNLPRQSAFFPHYLPSNRVRKKTERTDRRYRPYAQMILAISIVVSVLTAALFFKDFFDDGSDFADCLTEASRDRHDGLTRFLNDPEGADDNGVSRFKLIAYLAFVIGSGLLVYVFFTKHFGSSL